MLIELEEAKMVTPFRGHHRANMPTVSRSLRSKIIKKVKCAIQPSTLENLQRPRIMRLYSSAWVLDLSQSQANELYMSE